MKFIADNNLKPLAKRLRMFGLDCAYEGGISTPDLIQTAIGENRIFLTCKAIASTPDLAILRVSSNDPAEQLRQLTSTYPLEVEADPFSRCLVCNVKLQKISDITKEQVNLPDSVIARKLQVCQCLSCQRCYWHGSHMVRMVDILKRAGVVTDFEHA